MTIAVEHRHLGSDLHVAQLDQGMFRIAQDWQMISILFDGLANIVRSFTFVWIDEPELRLAGVELSDSLESRCIAARHRTIPAEKNEHHDFSGIDGERIDRVSIQIKTG